MALNLNVHNLTMKYDSFPVLDGVDFSIGQGEMTALLGSNGAGKSTLLRCISRALEPTGGAVFLSGKEAGSFTSAEIARQIAVVPQDTGVDFDFTVEEVVRMGRYPYLKQFRKEGLNDEHIACSAMGKTGILPLRHRSAVTLSGGERQRMVFARALCQQPKLLLLDEPTANLDIGYQWELLEIAQQLNREKGLTVLAAIHDLNLATLFFRRFILLAEGKILALGAAENVLTEKNILTSYGVPAAVFRHPLHGRIQVSICKKQTYLAEEVKEQKDKSRRIHVVGGGREAIPVLELLQDKGYALSVGPVSREDSGYLFARYFGFPVIEVPPFTGITGEIHREHLKLLREAAAIVLPPIAFGPGNLCNLKAVEESFCGERLVLALEKEGEVRDFTGGEAARIFGRLKGKGALCITDTEEALAKLEALRNTRN